MSNHPRILEVMTEKEFILESIQRLSAMIYNLADNTGSKEIIMQDCDEIGRIAERRWQDA